MKTAGLPAAVQETLQIFWESPFPATLQDRDFRIVDVNDAFVEFSGYARSTLIGRDPIDLQHVDERPTARERLQQLDRMIRLAQHRLDAPGLRIGGVHRRAPAGGQ